MRFRLTVLIIAAFVFALTGMAFAKDEGKAEKAKKPTKCEQKFQSLDKTGAGSITLEDYMANGGCKKCSKKQAERYFKIRDKNGDGKVTVDEFCPKKAKKVKKEKAKEPAPAA